MKKIFLPIGFLCSILPSTQAFAGELGFFEIIVRNQKQTQSFYSNTLGWKFQDMGAKDFALISNAGAKGALLSTTEKMNHGSSVKIFFKSQNLSDDLAKIRKAGGSVEIEPTDTGGGTWIAEFKDPDGNWIGLICEGNDLCAQKR